MSWMDKLSDDEKRELLYWLLSKQLLEIPRALVAEIDTGELDKRMEDIDWNYMVYDPLQDHTEAETPEDKAAFIQLQQIVLDLQKLEAAGDDGIIASQLLQIKYWQGTDMEIQISQVDNSTFMSPVEQDITPKFLKKLNDRLKSEKMKEENFDYLANEIKYGGFDERMIPALKESMLRADDKFELTQSALFGKDEVDVVLRFSRSEKSGYYYFNDFDLRVRPEADISREFNQHIPRNRDAKFTLKQGYNLAAGRAVGIVHINDQKQVVESWALQDKKFSYPDGSPHIRILPSSYKYEIEKVLSKYAILELRDEDERTALLNNLRRGNPAAASIERADGIHVNVYLTANPLVRSINVYDASNRQKLNPNLFLAQGREQKNQAQETGKTEAPGDMEAPDLPDTTKKRKQNR